uniref:Uncharacterized protein n=1 Tax=Fagus sylvatica TaxID=28930 RepID=A0A2N9EGB7_FAGSY
MDSQSTATLMRSFPPSGPSLFKQDLAGSNEILPDLVRSRVILTGSGEISLDLGRFSPEQKTQLEQLQIQSSFTSFGKATGLAIAGSTGLGSSPTE